MTPTHNTDHETTAQDTIVNEELLKLVDENLEEFLKNESDSPE